MKWKELNSLQPHWQFALAIVAMAQENVLRAILQFG